MKISIKAVSLRALARQHDVVPGHHTSTGNNLSAASQFKLGYQPSLDGLRGVSVVMVLFAHARVPHFEGGNFGVDVFFVLSGFLITALLLEEADANGGKISYANFFARRALRLFPAMSALLVAALAFSFVVSDPMRSRAIRLAVWLTAVYITNWQIAYADPNLDILRHAWSLSIEEQFYLLYPVVAVSLAAATGHRRWRMAAILFAGALASGALRCTLLITGSSPLRLYSGTDTRADSLLVGCAIATALSAGWTPSRGVVRWAAGAGLIFLAVGIGFGRWDKRSVLSLGYSFAAASAGAIVLHLVIDPESVLHRGLKHRRIVALGKMSYGLYLWHFPVIYSMYLKGFSWVTTVAFGIPLSLFFMFCSYYLIELPALRLKKKFPGRGTGSGRERSAPLP